MTQEPPQDSTKQQFQIYDSSLKTWISQQASTILPLLLPGTTYEATLNVELVPPAMRVDKVFKVLYHGEEHVLDVEFESGYDNKLKSRLLVYNAKLYHKYGLPVLTIVMYPFSTTVAKSPLCILSRKNPILTFHFKTLPLFRLDAEKIVRQQHACMYPLVPAMQNVDADLMHHVVQAITEIYRDDRETLHQQYTCLQVLLSRTGTITDVEKVKIKERLHMFQELFDGSPIIQEIREKSLIQGLQRALVNVIRTKYPDLVEFAQQQASHFDIPDVLDLLTQQVLTAPDANTARKLLESGPQM